MKRRMKRRKKETLKVTFKWTFVKDKVGAQQLRRIYDKLLRPTGQKWEKRVQWLKTMCGKMNNGNQNRNQTPDP